MGKEKVQRLETQGLNIDAIAGILFVHENDPHADMQFNVRVDDYTDEQKSKYNKFRDSLARILENNDTEYLAERGFETDLYKND